jgi:tetratricopeptide (TPR) repeat protein
VVKPRDIGGAAVLPVKSWNFDVRTGLGRAALLAECHWHAALLGWSDSPERSMEKALELARRAADTDGSNWLAYTYLGLLQLWGQHELPSAMTNVERGVELNPSASLARHVQACTLGFGGNPENALPQLDIALRLDPRYVHRATILADKSLFYFLMGDIDGAIDTARRALAEQPGYVRAQQRLVAALSAAGRRSEAIAELETLRWLPPDFGLTYIASTYPLVQSKDMEAFVAAFQSLGVD